jgi:hypothetical protein
MRSKILLAVSLAAILLAACSPAGSLPMGDNTLAVGESVNGEGVTVTFVSVLEDNRCPADAICVRSGEVRVLLRSTVGGNSQDHTLTLGDMAEGDVSSITVGGHTFTLTEVNPYPLASDPTDFADYTITLNVGH